MNVRELNRFCLLVCAPFLGMIAWLAYHAFPVELSATETRPLTLFSITEPANAAIDKLESARLLAEETRGAIGKFYELYEQSSIVSSDMLQVAAAQIGRPRLIFDNRVSAVLGKPIRTVSSEQIELKLYAIRTEDYRGHAMKVELKSDRAMRMVLGEDTIPGAETTLSAVKRHGAVAGINAGGFADGADGKRFPLSTTMLNGRYVYGFEPSFDALAFVGISQERKLIGGSFTTQAELDKLKPSFGATFVPVLLQNGVRQPIPAKWLQSPRRAPRTVIGSFGNDQLLFIVTDGYRDRGGPGATLPELQDMLAALRIVDAYNLDGGGSSSLIFDGAVINNPSDGKLRPLPTHFLFFK